MHVQAKISITEIPILIIGEDAEFASHVAKQVDNPAYSTNLASPHDDITQLIVNIQPIAIVIVDDGAFALGQLEISALPKILWPILIFISDEPTDTMFSAADYVMPKTYLRQLGQVIASQITRVQQITIQEKHWAALEADKEQLTQELVTANKISAEMTLLKQAIVHGVSHELRTPMLQVKSAVALLSEDENINRTIVDLAMEATIRLEGGIRNVTLLNELMNENPSNQSFSAAHIVQLVQAAVRNLGRSWEHKKEIGRITITASNNLCEVLCDRQRLTIAIQLLLDNALKFSTDIVVVEITEQDKIVTVRIIDRGIGIAPEQAEKIFEPFYQIDGTSTRKYGGMGIGLAIVRLIMDQHLTAIRLDSRVGYGSTFAFDLTIPDIDSG